ncbi:MAG: YdcF family protein [Myxococcales bacterium]|nr:YdcF family protein [Myxococcota bacterium]MDW8281760.1 YdcF family protein [Myxococcales bacterium]
MLPLRLALSLLLPAAGCAAWHDLFQRDRPTEALVQAALAVPGPAVADVALVLGCPAAPDGTLSPCQQCRVRSAVRSFRQGRARYLLFSGGDAHNPWVEAEVMARAAVALGVPPERVLREDKALTTWQNVRLSWRLMRRHGLRTALVITTADHLPRARRFVQYHGLPATYRACDREPPEEDGARPAPPAPEPASPVPG